MRMMFLFFAMACTPEAPPLAGTTPLEADPADPFTDLDPSPAVFEAELAAKQSLVDIGGTLVEMLTYGAQLPGPEIRVVQGDRVIFDPFFTTKSKSGGTGLGLSTSHGIITQAGGHLWVYSEPGEGTSFKIYLPVAHAPVTRPSRDPVTLDALGGTETVLVVDDEPDIVELCTSVLTRLGYIVLGAQSVDEAVRFARRFSGAIHAVIADMRMPGGSGPLLVARRRERRPGLPMLYMWGYMSDARIEAISGAAHIEKPFTPRQLASALRLLLGPRET